MPTSTRRDRFLAAQDAELLNQCDVDTYRASGPGGQKRNKTDSAIRLRHNPTNLMAVANESRSQQDNRRRAIKRLRLTIALQMREPIDLENHQPRPDLADCLREFGKLRVGKRDRRYIFVVAELLDCLEACHGRVSPIAKLLGISTANLVAFFAADDKLWARANQMRLALGQATLKKR